MTLPTFRPLPEPHLSWIDRVTGQMATVWREYLQSLDTSVRRLRGYEASATFDPSSLSDGAGETTTVAVAGAALGDFAQASFSVPLSGVMMTAWVSDADEVSVRFQNETGSPVDLAEGTLRVRTVKA